MKTDHIQLSKDNPDLNPDPITGEPGSHPVGTGIGAAGGAAMGAAVGSLGGPLGMAIGGAIGAFAGGLAGKEVAESFDPTLETDYWQEHFRGESYVEPQHDFEDYGPAYLLGAGRHEPHRSFEEAEKDMGDEWNRVKGGGTGTPISHRKIQPIFPAASFRAPGLGFVFTTRWGKGLG